MLLSSQVFSSALSNYDRYIDKTTRHNETDLAQRCRRYRCTQLRRPSCEEHCYAYEVCCEGLWTSIFELEKCPIQKDSFTLQLNRHRSFVNRPTCPFRWPSTIGLSRKTVLGTHTLCLSLHRVQSAKATRCRKGFLAIARQVSHCAPAMDPTR